MKNISYSWWNKNKMNAAPVASVIMWAISVLCFVFGLSFKNPMGIQVASIDISIVIAFALSIANTIIQLIGNGQDTEKMDGVFKAGWYASYVLGISSNINALLTIIGIQNPILEWAVCGALGTMIEIMPEKMIVIWLKSGKPETAQAQHAQQNRQAYGNPSLDRLRSSQSQSQKNRPTPRPQPVSPAWAQAYKEVEDENPVYHQVAANRNVPQTYNRRDANA